MGLVVTEDHGGVAVLKLNRDVTKTKIEKIP